MDEEQVRALARVAGLVLRQLKEYRTEQVLATAPPVESISDVFYLLRRFFSPPLTVRPSR
jgi:serine protease AprX